MLSILGPHRSRVLRRLVRGSIGLALMALPTIAQTKLWIDQFGSDSSDAAFAVATDNVEGVFIAGFVGGYGNGAGVGRGDALLARYDASGQRLWAQRFGDAETKDWASAAVPDGAGGVFVAGMSYGGSAGASMGLYPRWIAHFDGLGMQHWMRPIQKQAIPAAGVSNGVGGLLLCGSISGQFAPDSWVASFDPSGALLWSTSIQILVSSWDEAYSVASDGSGGAFACGISSASFAPYDGWLARVDGSGNLLWTTKFITSFHDYAYAVAGDGSGGVYVGGSTAGTLAGSSHGSGDMWLARYDAAGIQLWIRQDGSSQPEGIRALAPSDGGGVLAAVRVGAKAWLGRFDSDGTPIYLAPVGPKVGFFATEVIASDGRGCTYIAGGTDSTIASGSIEWGDVWLARYDGSCNSGETYCVASSTSIAGCQASISAIGSPSLTDPTAWTVSSGPVPGATLGLLLFGSSGKDNTPFGTLGGQLCVAAPTFRSAPKTSGGDQGQCNGSYSFTLADLMAASPIVTSGATIHSQVWARDPANADGFLLSNGLQFQACP